MTSHFPMKPDSKTTSHLADLLNIGSKKDGQLPIHTPTGNVHTPSIFDIQVRPNLTAFAKTLTPEALRYLYLGIDLGQTIGNCSQ